MENFNTNRLTNPLRQEIKILVYSRNVVKNNMTNIPNMLQKYNNNSWLRINKGTSYLTSHNDC